MKCISTLRVPVIDLNGYKEKLHEYMVQILKEAATKWLESTAHYVPVWSGASRSTFAPLASQVEYALSVFPIAPSRVDIGLDHAVGTFETKPNGIYQFTYVTDLSWLVINENYDATQWGFHLKIPGPYHFQARGDTIFRMFADDVELPNVQPFIHSMVI